METAIEERVRRSLQELLASTARGVSIQTQKFSYIDGIKSESLSNVVPGICQLATISVLKDCETDEIIQNAFAYELANNKGVTSTAIQDSGILKLYEGMRFILGHIELNHSDKVRDAMKRYLEDITDGKVTLGADFSDFQCLQLLTYSHTALPNVEVFFTNDPEWFHKAGAIGRNIYAHQQWTRWKERATLWINCFGWNGIDTDGMADYGENMGIYQGKVVSWNGSGRPEHVFQTFSTDKPFSKFICDRATFIASLLGKTYVFIPTDVCIL